eukprot:CAMPEP_0197676528 /NCGR_PEP_ID=MMETSP1338-20131121/86960_1 /TAXON_ID=43686 ORGANISM="Pelagodinium beii, Strain RCC1491" /NCGR_SAMPLE_ID=MMETSP1338 /ASSEMBLY_ACC=CAM_ASM_000754 /LENGTH=112 /DNA_ID=CAMNT_0043257217 /DNA_START=18 /DNA_END=356 /DNA_ORIENTATION=+
MAPVRDCPPAATALSAAVTSPAHVVSDWSQSSTAAVIFKPKVPRAKAALLALTMQADKAVWSLTLMGLNIVAPCWPIALGHEFIKPAVFEVIPDRPLIKVRMAWLHPAFQEL